MRVLIPTLYCKYTPHFETELEIIQLHLDKGDEVTILGCDFSFPSCDLNVLHKKKVCFRCVGRRKTGMKTIEPSVAIKPIYNLSRKDKEEVMEVQKKFHQDMDLKELFFGEFDIGYGVLSSLISSRRDPTPDLKDEKISKMARNLLLAAASTYLSMKNYLSEQKYDRVYVFNGRFAIMRAILRACQHSDVDCYCHERGSTLDKYALFKNRLPHDRELFRKNMIQTWNDAEDQERVTIGSEFFTERRGGIEQNWFSFTKDQTQGHIPSNWDESKRNVVIFNHSEDEKAAIGKQWENPIYPTQNLGIRKILSEFSGDSDWHFYLRVHPNLKGVDNEQMREIASLDIPNLTVIPADNPISSYALLDVAEKAVVFASTMGIEATYWGVPSILLGKAYYGGMNAVYEPESHTEGIEMIRAHLEPKQQIGALKYGYYKKTFGEKFKYYKASGLFEGKFKGQVIKVDPLYQHIADFYNIPQEWKRKLSDEVMHVGSYMKKLAFRSIKKNK